MNLKKHQTAKIAKGLYNYRGYNIQLLGPRHWVIYAEDDTVAAQTRTLSGMKRTCDRWEKLAAIEARALSNDQVQGRSGEKRESPSVLKPQSNQPSPERSL